MKSRIEDKKTFYFDAIKFGRELKEISADLIIKESKKVESRWFHSKNEIDLFLWQDNEQNLIKQQFCYFGQVVEWNIIEGLRTGTVISDVNEYGEEVDVGSPLVQYDKEPHKLCVLQALEVIVNIPDLEDKVKKNILDNFKKSPSIDNLDPEEFISRYGNSIGLAKKNRAVGLVARFLTFLKKIFNSTNPDKPR